MMSAARRGAILISGRGSNMTALLAATAEPTYPIDFVLVASDDPSAPGLERARAAGAATAAIPWGAPRPGARADFEARLEVELRAADVDLICLAGFMRILSPDFAERWRDRVLNIHPSLLPSFKGLDTHARALAAGVRLHGATVHLVRAAIDDGPILGQAALAVGPDDDPTSLAERVLHLEHMLYPRAAAAYASGRTRLLEERVIPESASDFTHAILI